MFLKVRKRKIKEISKLKKKLRVNKIAKDKYMSYEINNTTLYNFYCFYCLILNWY